MYSKVFACHIAVVNHRFRWAQDGEYGAIVEIYIALVFNAESEVQQLAGLDAVVLRPDSRKVASGIAVYGSLYRDVLVPCVGLNDKLPSEFTQKRRFQHFEGNPSRINLGLAQAWLDEVQPVFGIFGDPPHEYSIPNIRYDDALRRRFVIQDIPEVHKKL